MTGSELSSAGGLAQLHLQPIIEAAPPFAVFEGWETTTLPLQSSFLLVVVRSREQVPILRSCNADNYSKATARVRSPILASPDFDVCNLIFRHACEDSYDKVVEATLPDGVGLA